MKLASKSSYAAGCDSPKCQKYNETAVDLVTTDADLAVVCLGTGKTLTIPTRSDHKWIT